MLVIKSLSTAHSKIVTGSQKRILLFLVFCVGVVTGYAILFVGLVWSDPQMWALADFTAFYTAGRLVADGQAGQLYSLEAQHQLQQAILQPYGVDLGSNLLPFVNPPFLAGIMVPFSHLALSGAFLTWLATNLALLVASVTLLLRSIDVSSWQVVLAVSFIVLAFFPVYQGLIHGQSTFWVLACLSLAIWGLKTNRDLLAGTALAAGLIKPQLIILIVASLIVWRRWRAVLGFFMTSAGLLFLSWLMVGAEGFLAFANVLTTYSGANGQLANPPAPMPNLLGTLFRMSLVSAELLDYNLSPKLLRAGYLVSTIGVLGLLVWSWQALRPYARSGLFLGLAVSITGSLLISPHLYRQDLALLVIVAFLIWIYSERFDRSDPTIAGAMIVHGGLLVSATAFTALMAGQLEALMLVVVLFLLVLKARKQAKHVAPHNHPLIAD